jgi:CBS domain containing-hemolysin-like protein
VSDSALWIAVVGALLSCFFSATNYALVDFSRARLLELLQSRGKEQRLEQLLAMADGLLLLTATLRTICNLFVLVGLVAVFIPRDLGISWFGLLIPTLIAVGIIAVFGVAIPVSWSRHAAEPLLATSFPLLRVLHIVTKPLVAVLHWFDPLMQRLLGVPPAHEDDTSPMEQEILDALSEGEKTGMVDEDQKEMIEAVVEFPTLTVEQIMTPRTEVEGIDVVSTLETVKDFVAKAGHSRVPVYEGDLDHIVGVLYVKDLIALLGAEPNGFDLRQFVRPAVFVPETKLLGDLLGQFKASKVHMAIVLDEYGGTAGLVTIEDVLEEIVGEIQDEYEPPEPDSPIHRIDEKVAEVEGRAYVDDVNDELDCDIPDDEDYDTIGGFVFSTLGRIPEVGESFDYQNLRITVTDAEKTRVNRVRIERIDQTTEAAAPH